MKPIKIKKGYYKLSFENLLFLKNVSNSLINCLDKTNQNSIFFYATEVQPLKEFIKQKLIYSEIYDIFHNVGSQLQDLHKKKLTIPFFSISDIIVIKHNESHIFLYINEKKLYTIHDGKIQIDTPLDNSMFFSPELESIKILPTTISFKSGFFSLASMVATIINPKKLDKTTIEKGFFWKSQRPKNYKHDFHNKSLLLDMIYNTELYWALERCLTINPNNRYFLFI